MFQFPITSLWQDCRSRISFKTLKAEKLRTVPIHLPPHSPPQMRKWRNMGFPLVDIWGRLSRIFRIGPFAWSPNAVLGDDVTRQLRHLFLASCSFSVWCRHGCFHEIYLSRTLNSLMADVCLLKFKEWFVQHLQIYWASNEQKSKQIHWTSQMFVIHLADFAIRQKDSESNKAFKTSSTYAGRFSIHYNTALCRKQITFEKHW